MTKIMSPRDDAADHVDRRGFLQRSGAAGLLYAFSIVAPGRGAHAAGSSQPIGAFVRIGTDESVTMLVGVSEMGQGIASGIAQVIAEELMVDWSQVSVQTVNSGTTYGNPFLRGTQGTFGSLSMRGYFAPMRKAGATVREMLRAAAAQAMNAPLSSLIAANGRVTAGSGAGMTYGQLAALAVQQTPMDNPPLLGTGKYVGVSLPRTDIPAKTTGAAVFGLDVRLPNMLYAAVVHSPVFGGILSGALPPPPSGAIAVVGLDTAVAVIARDTYTAFRAAQSLSVQWQPPTGATTVSTGSVLAQAQQLMTTGEVQTAETVGLAQAAIVGASAPLDLTFSFPYVAHACMEVLNCTALVTSTSCTIWAPTQAQTATAATAARLTGLPAAAITVNTTLLGGGLGRKIEQDFISQAIRIAQTVPGTPVKLTWSREQDFAADQYRSAALVRARASVDAMGNVSWWTRLVAPSYAYQHGGSTGIDFIAIAGATGLPYAFTNKLVEYVRHPAAVPVGSWRAIGCSINTFVTETMLDEIAAITRSDPLSLRRRLLASNPRALAVLDAAAAMANWTTPPGTGRARGIAFCFSDNAYVALVVELSQPTAGSLRIITASCAVDVGMAVNPDSVTAQIEGGIVHGLSAALWGEVPISNGRATVRNFNNYRIIRMRDMPTINVRLLDGNPNSLGGAGEISVPPVAPAVANAVASLTGQRLRSLPLLRALTGGTGGSSSGPSSGTGDPRTDSGRPGSSDRSDSRPSGDHSDDEEDDDDEDDD